jgi:putative DNA primase/helicase
MTAFEDWKAKAQDADLLQEAIRYGAKLKRAGREWIGPCVACGGRDRFSINPSKGKWHCRGYGGGADAIGLVQHVAGLSFKEAVEAITGEPCPSGPARPISESERAERNRRRIAAEDAQRAREAQETIQNQDTLEFCAKIVSECVPVAGTLAEKYLHLFHLPTPPDGWPECLMFHPALNYPGKRKMPALVARVDDVSGQMTGIWREFIREDGRKADVEFQKLGLGPVAGGAVRIGGMGERIGCAEGVRTALGAWALIGFKYPVWSCLSTAGLIGFEAPLGVDRITIYPDSDRPIKKHGEEYVPAIPAGRKAAHAMRDRLVSEGVAVTIASEPAVGRDYLDVWRSHAQEVA